MLRDQESTRAIHISSKHKERVYEKAHIEVKMSQYVESNVMIKHMKNYLYLNHSKQKTETIKAPILHPESSLLHMTRERERDVQVLDPKGLVSEYLGTQDVDTIQIYSTYHED
jgi:hypothetical protein